MSTESIHPAASHHLPSFITAPGETDTLMVIMAVILALAVLGFGIFFFRLHSLPERMAHKSQKLQFEIVAVLGLISLFTHMHIFWIAGLLLALIDLPNIGDWLNRIALSLEKIAMRKTHDGQTEDREESVVNLRPQDLSNKTPHSNVDSIRRVEDSPSINSESGREKRRELTRA